MGLLRWMWVRINPIFFVKTWRALYQGENLSKASDRKLLSSRLLRGHEFNSVKSVYVCGIIYFFMRWFDGYFGNEISLDLVSTFSFVPYTIPWCFYFLPQVSIRTIFFLKKKRRRKNRVIREWRYIDGSRGVFAQIALSVAYVLYMPYRNGSEDILHRYEAIPTAGWVIFGILAFYGFLHQSGILITTIPRRVLLVGIEISHMLFFFVSFFSFIVVFLVIPGLTAVFVHFQFDVPFWALSSSMFGTKPLSDFWFNR